MKMKTFLPLISLFVFVSTLTSAQDGPELSDLSLVQLMTVTPWPDVVEFARNIEWNEDVARTVYFFGKRSLWQGNIKAIEIFSSQDFFSDWKW